jgi:hypothetical protein
MNTFGVNSFQRLLALHPMPEASSEQRRSRIRSRTSKHVSWGGPMVFLKSLMNFGFVLAK